MDIPPAGSRGSNDGFESLPDAKLPPEIVAVESPVAVILAVLDPLAPDVLPDVFAVAVAVPVWVAVAFVGAVVEPNEKNNKVRTLDPSNRAGSKASSSRTAILSSEQPFNPLDSLHASVSKRWWPWPCLGQSEKGDARQEKAIWPHAAG